MGKEENEMEDRALGAEGRPIRETGDRSREGAGGGVGSGTVQGRQGAKANLYTAVHRKNLFYRSKRLRRKYDQRLAGEFQRLTWPRPMISQAFLAPA